ncbi:MAG: hypothetical protein PHI73_04110 [Patescibacteria group bacterium]|nr:hypothetical protein [Patescibacteria group bacterium]
MKVISKEDKYILHLTIYLVVLLVLGFILSILINKIFTSITNRYHILLDNTFIIPFYAAFFGACLAFIFNGISRYSYKKYYYRSLKVGLLYELKIARDRMDDKGLPGISFEVFKTCCSDPIFLQKIEKDIPDFLSKSWEIITELRFVKMVGGRTAWSTAAADFKETEHYESLCNICEILEKSIKEKK